MKFVLQKEIEKTKFVLQKKDVKNIKAHVVVDLDVSGSTQDLYASGAFQKAFQRILPVGIVFDDNQEIDVFTFNNGERFNHIETNATQDNFENYIQKHILENKNVDRWGGTDYAPVLNANLEEFGFYRSTEKKSFFGLFNKKSGERTLTENSKSGHPVIIYFLTDGQNSDQDRTALLLQECEDKHVNAYIQFIGIGEANFRFIEELARKHNNVGFAHLREFEKIVDGDAFTDIILNDELCNYLRNQKAEVASA
jgi:hypothetical protein